MQKQWLASYPPGVPQEVAVDAHASLAELLEQSLARHRERPAISNFGTTLRYADLDRLSADFAAFLRSDLGLAPGERVALMLPNLLQHPVALLGTLRAGLVAVNVNPLYTARELEHQLRDSGALVIVVLENFAQVLQACIARTAVRHVVLTRMGDLLRRPKGWVLDFVVKHVKHMVPPFELPGALRWPEALERGRRAPRARAVLGRDDLALLQYTGGTTGVAKGAMLTHGNMVANILQARAWMDGQVGESGEVVVTALPLYHIFALTANCFCFLTLGAHNHLITNPRDMRAFVRAIARLRFSVITGVNTLFNGLLAAPGFEAVDFSALKVSLAGGMALQRGVAERWKAVTGCPLIEAYGLTETAPAVCINPLTLREYNGSIGLPLPSTECSIRDDAGMELATGEVGELCVRGPQVMAGYWQRPDETAQVFTADGALRTGDIARIDERGYVFVVDRKKDMINVSGFNVYPNEIEEVVSGHPGVGEVAAVGVPSPRSGEMVKLFVVRSDPALEAQALIAWCKVRLTAYKMPREVEFRDALPKTPVGKILRRMLREEQVPPAG